MRSHEIPSFIRHSEKYRETAPPPALMAAMGEFVQRSLRDGTLVEVRPMFEPNLGP